MSVFFFVYHNGISYLGYRPHLHIRCDIYIFNAKEFFM